MKLSKFAPMSRLFRRRKSAALSRAVELTADDEKIAQISAKTGVSIQAITLFSNIADRKDFTAADAYKDFGHIKLKEVA